MNPKELLIASLIRERLARLRPFRGGGRRRAYYDFRKEAGIWPRSPRKLYKLVHNSQGEPIYAVELEQRERKEWERHWRMIIKRASERAAQLAAQRRERNRRYAEKCRAIDPFWSRMADMKASNQ